MLDQFIHNCLKIFILIATLSVPIANALPNQGYPDVKTFIAHQTTIRILVDAGPGFGNQANNANLVSWLNQYGFKGTIEMIYPDAVTNKISTLFDLPEKLPDDYSFKYNDKIIIHFIKFREHVSRLINHILPRVDLGMSGAFDGENICEDLQDDHVDTSGLTTTQCTNFANFVSSNTFTRLNPYIGDERLATNLYQFNQNSFQQLNNSKTFITTPVASYQDAMTYLTKDPRGQDLLAKKPALKTLLNGMDQNQYNIMFVYGWTILLYDSHEAHYRKGWFPGNILQILTAARFAQLHGTANFHKPLVIAVFYDYGKEGDLLTHLIPSEHWGKFELPGAAEARNLMKTLGLNGAFSYADISDPHTIQTLEHLQPNQILMVSLGSLPKIVFDGLYNHTGSNIWPQVREGANSFNSLILTGKPHFRCTWSWELTFDLIKDQDLKARLEKLYTTDELPGGLCRGMESWKDTPHVPETYGELILESSQPKGSLSQYFIDLKKEAIDPKNDRIYISLTEILHRINSISVKNAH